MRWSPAHASRRPARSQPISELPAWRHVCRLHRVGLEKLECDLLSQHEVADRQVPFGCEAQHVLAPAVLVECLDVQRRAIADAIARPARSPNDLKIIVARQLMTLGRSEIANEQPQALTLCS